MDMQDTLQPNFRFKWTLTTLKYLGINVNAASMTLLKNNATN